MSRGHDGKAMSAWHHGVRTAPNRNLSRPKRVLLSLSTTAWCAVALSASASKDAARNSRNRAAVRMMPAKHIHANTAKTAALSPSSWTPSTARMRPTKPKPSAADMTYTNQLRARMPRFTFRASRMTVSSRTGKTPASVAQVDEVTESTVGSVLETVSQEAR